MADSTITLVECPRDAWQGLAQIIPTEEKIKYLTSLVSLGFRHIDAVSFVSPRHVPQMADSEAVMAQLSEARTPSGEAPEIIGIVVNEQGLQRALATPGVTTIGYPYSISAYFRRANANMSRAESRALVEKLRRDTKAAGRKLVVYISMAFGNPYDEPWGPEIVEDTLVWLKDVGVRTVSLADTVGHASPRDVATLMRAANACVAGIEIGVHLHSRPDGAAEKVLAAYEAIRWRIDRSWRLPLRRGRIGRKYSDGDYPDNPRGARRSDGHRHEVAGDRMCDDPRSARKVRGTRRRRQ
jgi:hydroxymethylglutaryl-CoA lyase